MQASMDFTPIMPVDRMGEEEIRWRLLEALRDGRLENSEELRGIVLGYCAAVKRGRKPSLKQEQTCRTLVREVRRVSWEDNGPLLDKGDET